MLKTLPQPLHFFFQSLGSSRVVGFANLLVMIVLIGLCGSGCASRQKSWDRIRASFYDDRLEIAESQLDEIASRSKSDRDVAKLNQAMIQLWSGHPKEAEKLLLQSRNLFHGLQGTALRDNLVSLATDETHREFVPEDYELVLLRAMLAFSNLVDDGEDVLAYAFQINQTQQELIRLRSSSNEAEQRQQVAQNPAQGGPRNDAHQKAKSEDAEKQLALGPYLYGLIREATCMNYDDAARGYARVVDWAPEFSQGPSDLARARNGVHSAPGRGVVYLFAMVGRGPYKAETVEIPTTQAMFFADRLLSVVGKHNLTPTVSPIKIAEVIQPHNPLDRILVQTPDGRWGQTEVISDLGALAVRQSEERRNEVVGRAVARRALKKAALYATKEATSSDGVTSLALDLVGMAWEASESADTRCWEFLPETVQVLRMELPVGRHRLTVQPAYGKNRLGNAESLTVNVQDGRNQYIMVNYPGMRRVGQVLQSSGH